MRVYFYILIFLTFIFSFFIPGTRVLGCGNEYEEVAVTNNKGQRVHIDEYSIVNYTFISFDEKDLRSRKRQLEDRLKKKYSFEKESDYALVLLKLGESKKSLTILQRLGKKHPKEYNIIANLGTAYELNGIDDSALFYIKKAIKINPQSHEGSEWIHVEILKAKLEMKKNPDLLKSRSILNIEVDPRESYNANAKSKFKITKEQLYWQLKERIAFVKPTDPVVADLLFTFANLVAVTDYLESSIPIYELCIKYQPQDIDQVLYIKNHVSREIKIAAAKSYSKYVFLFFIFVGGIYFLFIKIRKWRRNKKFV